jgi:hypothetical protein
MQALKLSAGKQVTDSNGGLTAPTTFCETMTIYDLTVPELRKLGEETYNLELPKTAAKSQLLKIIIEAAGGEPENIAVPDREEIAEETKDEGRIKVLFYNSDDVAGNTKIVCIVNGKRWEIPREVEVKLPPEVLHTIDNAAIVEPYWDEEGREHVRTKKRFPYTRV